MKHALGYLLLILSPSAVNANILFYPESLEIRLTGRDEIQQATAIIINDSTEESAYVSGIQVDCNCFEIQLQTPELRPGESSEIRVNIDPNRIPFGVFTKRAILQIQKEKSKDKIEKAFLIQGVKDRIVTQVPESLCLPECMPGTIVEATMELFSSEPLQYVKSGASFSGMDVLIKAIDGQESATNHWLVSIRAEALSSYPERSRRLWVTFQDKDTRAVSYTIPVDWNVKPWYQIPNAVEIYIDKKEQKNIETLLVLKPNGENAPSVTRIETTSTNIQSSFTKINEEYNIAINIRVPDVGSYHIEYLIIYFGTEHDNIAYVPIIIHKS